MDTVSVASQAALPPPLVAIVVHHARSVAMRRLAHLERPSDRDDAVAEVIAIAWQRATRDYRAGKNVERMAWANARYAMQSWYYGRRLCGMENGEDCLSPRAARLHGFAVLRQAVDSDSVERQAVELLADDRSLSPLNQVQIKLDLQRFCNLRNYVDCRAVRLFASGHNCKEVGARIGRTHGTVRHLRKRLKAAWLAYYV